MNDVRADRLTLLVGHCDSRFHAHPSTVDIRLNRPVILASAPWYTSATFWTGIGVVAAIAAIAVTIVLWRLGTPRREILYHMRAVQLLTSDFAGRGNERLEVSYDGQLVRDPYVAGVVVASLSRRDIRSADFDGGTPLEFVLGVTIVASVGEASGSAAADPDLVTLGQQSVSIAPHLMRKGLVLRMELLTDGQPAITPRSPIADVMVVPGTMEERQEANETLRSLVRANVLFLTVLLVLVFLLGTGSIASRVGGILFAWVCFGPGMSWFVLRRREKRARKKREGNAAT